MNERLRDVMTGAGAEWGQRCGAEVATAFTSVADEVAAARRAAVVAPWTTRGIFGLTGGDRTRFLHGQCTQNVEGLSVGEGGAAFVLDAKGKNQADIRFLVEEDRLLVETDHDRVDHLLAWFDRFLIADDVVLHDLRSDLVSLLVLGPASTEAMGRLGVDAPPTVVDHFAVITVDDAPVRVVFEPDFGDPGYRLVTDPATAATLFERFRAEGDVAAGFDALDALRIDAGTPWFGRELGDDVLPGETGRLQRIAHFEKGCYTGQEVVAMQFYRGKPRRMVRRIAVLDEGVAPGAAISNDDGLKGRVTSLSPLAESGERKGLGVLEGPEHAEGTPFLVTTDAARTVAGRVLGG